jgi:hypothetical protein
MSVDTAAELAANLARLTTRLQEMEQMLAERDTTGSAAAPAEEGQPPLYATVEQWVTTYLLPSFPRPPGVAGHTRWHWCEQWWRHDEAVTRLTALWYGWEHARLEMTGMLGWLRELDHHLPLLCGEDGPFRDCAPAADQPARHVLPTAPATEPAPAQWWDWWD